jgi:hypothetical protein
VRKVVWGWIITRGSSQIWLQVTDEMKVEKFRIKKGLRRALTISKGKFAQFRQIWRQKVVKPPYLAMRV